MSQGCGLVIFGSRGQKSGSQCIDNWKLQGKVKIFWCITAFPLHLSSRNFAQRLPSSRVCALWISGSKGQRSRLQCIDNWKWFMSHNWNFIQRLPLSRGYALWVSGSKGERSRSQCVDIWKWFMSHICFPFTSIILKLHTKTPHELMICPMGFGVKMSKVKVTMHC